MYVVLGIIAMTVVWVMLVAMILHISELVKG